MDISNMSHSHLQSVLNDVVFEARLRLRRAEVIETILLPDRQVEIETHHVENFAQERLTLPFFEALTLIDGLGGRDGGASTDKEEPAFPKRSDMLVVPIALTEAQLRKLERLGDGPWLRDMIDSAYEPRAT